MCGHSPHFGCAAGHQQIGRTRNGATRVDHVVGQDAQAAFNFTDDFFCHCNVGGVFWTTLVDECNVSVHVCKMLCKTLGNFYATSVRRHDHNFVARMLAHIFFEHWHCGEVIDWAFEKPLNLTAM